MHSRLPSSSPGLRAAGAPAPAAPSARAFRLARGAARVAGSAALGLLLAACQTPEGARLPEKTTEFAHENTEKFVLMDPGAQRSVTCTGIQERVLPDGRLDVAANLRNRENRRLQVQWQIVFKDAQGFVTEETPWQTVILTENGQEGVRAAALHPQAVRYTIRVREAR